MLLRSFFLDFLILQVRATGPPVTKQTPSHGLGDFFNEHFIVELVDFVDLNLMIWKHMVHQRFVGISVDE